MNLATLTYWGYYQILNIGVPMRIVLHIGVLIVAVFLIFRNRYCVAI